MHLLTTAEWYSTWSSIVWGLHNHTNAARRPQFTMQTALQHHLITCTEDVTAARRTLQRLHTDIFSKFLLEDVLLEKAFSDSIRRGFLVPYQKAASDNVLTFFHPDWGMLRRSRCIQVFLLTYNLYRERDCCTIHIAKATDVFSSKILLENVLLEKAFSDSIRRGFLVPYQKAASDNVLTFFHPDWGMLRRSRCIQVFLLTYNLYRERDCCTIHIAKATDVFSSQDCIFHVEQVPTD